MEILVSKMAVQDWPDVDARMQYWIKNCEMEIIVLYLRGTTMVSC